MLEDTSEGEILPAKAEEIAEEIGMKAVPEKSEELASAMTELRDAYLARQQEQEEGKQPASKKLKSVDTARLDAYGKVSLRFGIIPCTTYCESHSLKYFSPQESIFESSRSWRRSSVEPTIQVGTQKLFDGKGH